MGTGGSNLPPLDPDAGLHRRTWDDGTDLTVEITTVGEALDQSAEVAEKGYSMGTTFWAEAPDDVQVSDDGRLINVYYSPAARQQYRDEAA